MIMKTSYRHFDRLISVLIALNVMSYVYDLAVNLDLTPHFTTNGKINAVGIVGYAYFIALKIISVSVIFLRCLRDEYAERLWKAAAQSFAFTILTIPLVYVLLILVLFLSGHPLESFFSRDPLQSILPLVNRNQHEFVTVGHHELDGLQYAIMLIWQLGPILFFGLYKWHRWRDMR